MKKLLPIAVMAFTSTSAFASGSSNVTLTATLDGASVPYGGDSNGAGAFSARVDSGSGQICYNLQTSNIGATSGAHIHEGGSGTPGRPLIDLQVATNSCVAMDQGTLTEIVNDPSNFYVDVLTPAYPQGAIRGQLSR